MTLLVEAGHLINPSLACPLGYEGREKGMEERRWKQKPAVKAFLD